MRRCFKLAWQTWAFLFYLFRPSFLVTAPGASELFKRELVKIGARFYANYEKLTRIPGLTLLSPSLSLSLNDQVFCSEHEKLLKTVSNVSDRDRSILIR